MQTAALTGLHEHVNIKAQAMNKVFKIRFHATGVNSINILSWFVDNIHVYRACDAADRSDCRSTGRPAWNRAELDRTCRQLNIDEWIHWDDGVNSGNSIGTGGAAEFDVAARWEPAQLVDYEGASVTEIAFFPAEPTATYNVRVWVGAGAANLVVDQVVHPDHRPVEHCDADDPGTDRHHPGTVGRLLCQHPDGLPGRR